MFVGDPAGHFVTATACAVEFVLLRIGCFRSFASDPLRREAPSHASSCVRNSSPRALAHLARTGFFKPVHVKSLRGHALRSLISARKKLVSQRVTLENQIRGLAVVFGVRLPPDRGRIG
jgi:hypothetical protein